MILHFSYVIHGFLLLISISWVDADRGLYKGCFKDDQRNRQFPFKPNSPSASLTVDRCINACSDVYYMYAAIQDGKSCFCGSKYDDHSVANCTTKCAGNITQECGGPSANSIYLTGIIVPGPPGNLTNVTSDENSITIKWLPPVAINGGISNYKVSVHLLFTYDETKTHEELEWQLSNTTLNQTLTKLIPGSEYNVSLKASSPFGDGPAIFNVFWTIIGLPENPPEPEIINKDNNKLVIKLPYLRLKTGPTSAYQVIVYDESSGVAIDQARLANVSVAKSQNLSYYIAAELSIEQASKPFTVGDGATYKEYFNAPLPEDKSYNVLLRILSSLNGVTKVAFSKPAVYHGNIGIDVENKPSYPMDTWHPPAFHPQDVIEGKNIHILPRDHKQSDAHSSLVTGLSVAIAIGLILLVASIIAYFLIRRHYGKRNLSPDHQELTVHQSPPPEPNENGIASSVLCVNEEMSSAELFSSLQERYWHIPRSSLEILDKLLGQGKFGEIHSGLTHRRNHKVPVMVHSVADKDAMNDKDKRYFLNELESMVCLGINTNVVSFIGACDEKDGFHMVLEYFRLNLKDFLLESRALDHYPVFAEKQKRFTTLKEDQILELTNGIARGMLHLANNKILHRHLTSRHIIIKDGSVPMIGDFGIAQCEPVTEKYDYTRWTAVESLRNNIYATKSDVWAFGVVLWEVITLGGTPYICTKSKDVAVRVIRGMRLQQPKYLGDDLYQLMLHCWQIDMDERPTFSELTNILANMLNEDSHTDHVNLNLYPGFQYEKYDYQSELVISSDH